MVTDSVVAPKSLNKGTVTQDSKTGAITSVTPGGRFGRNHMGLWSDDFIEGHAQIAKVCHDAGAAVIIQLNHAGRDSAPDLGEQIAPSAVPTRDENVLAKEMSLDDIHDMQKSCAG